MWPDWGEVGAFLGGVAQSVQHGWNSLNALMKQTPMETAHALNKGLSNGSIQKAVTHGIVKTAVKLATGSKLDKAATLGVVVGEVAQVVLPGSDIAKAGDVAKLGDAAKVVEGASTESRYI